MTDEEVLVSRVERLEALVERQGATIQAERERIDKLEAVDGDLDRSASIDRRTALKAGGLAGLLALGTATGLPTTDMVGTAAETNLAGFDFTGTWATVTGPDDYPVLQAIDEQAQVEARG